jgi:Animal haem peroxidase
LHIKTGRTSAVPPNAPGGDNAFATVEREGFDLPRINAGPTPAERRLANIPDQRNDENLAVAQTQLAFIRFHNRVIDELAGTTPSALLFTTARDTVIKHYQWMLFTDFLPRIVEPGIVTDVFTNGRKFFEVPAGYDDPDWYPASGDNRVEPGDRPTMPIEFSVAAYRLGHSMVRDAYNWNAIFNKRKIPASLLLLFAFSGTSGILAPVVSPDQLSDPNAGTAALPGSCAAASNWPNDSASSRCTPARSSRVTVEHPSMVSPTTRKVRSHRTPPLWFYILREAELNGGRLCGVGGRIVAEVFHRAMEGSRASVVRDPVWRPTLGPDDATFRMVDLLLFAFEDKNELLAPLG